MPHAPMTGDHKANFDSIYDQPDPRAYFATLGPLDYQIPQNALPVVERVHRAAGSPGCVLDVCCSYGINGALLRFDVTIDELTRHYAASAGDESSAEAVAAADRAFFAGRARDPRPAVYGLDAAPHAVDYARRTDLITAGWAENLEVADPSAGLVDGLRDVGLVLCTGGVGYIGATTFTRLLEHCPDPGGLWLAVWVLREFGYDEIAAALDAFGLVTEQVPGTFAQRRFASADEQRAALGDVAARGLDPAGKEADGWFHADCFVSRPARSADVPLDTVLG